MFERNKEMLTTEYNSEFEILKEASKIVFVSNYYRTLYPAQFSEKYEVIHNGIDFQYFSEKIEKGKYDIPGKNGNKKVLFLGRFDSMKNVPVLIHSVTPESVDVIIAGSGFAGDSKFLEQLLLKNI